MVSEDRQRIMEANRSLRLIKNELESLLDKGIIASDAFDTIHSLLPAESSLSGSAGATPVSASASARASVASPPPPSYAPSLPQRSGPPPPPPGMPVLSHARALYPYTASDARDLSFQRDDRIAVHEYMNDDWWMGRNLRTDEEGIFPRSYVEMDSRGPPPPPLPPTPMSPGGGYPGIEKAGGWQGPPPPQPQYGGYYPPPPAQQSPYNSNVPPMAVAEQGGGGGGLGRGKVGELGKKFGRKLGNAAIFGAGATLGGDLVNSIL